MGKDFALVKWLTGEDQGKYTAGLPVEWIRDFDLDRFRKSMYHEDVSFITEWRSGKKPPPGGWPIYDIVVIEVSDKLRKLERKIELLSLEKSPRQPPNVELRTSPRKTSIRTALFQPAMKVTKSSEVTVHTPKKRKASPGGDGKKARETSQAGRKRSKDQPDPKGEGKSSSSKSSSSRAEPHTKAKAELKNQAETGKKLLDFSGRAESGIGILADEDVDGDHHFQGSNDLGVIRSSLEDVSRKLSDLSKNVQTIMEWQQKQQQQAPATAAISVVAPKLELSNRDISANNDLTVVAVGEGEECMMRLTSRGRTCTLSETSWNAGKNAITASAMTYALLLGAFDLSVLLESTLKGGKTKVGKNQGRQSKPLDPRILHVLKEAVKSRFPSFSDSQFGVAVNNKVSALKQKHFKDQPSTSQRHGKKGILDSDSDDDDNLEGKTEEKIDKGHDSPNSKSPIPIDLNSSVNSADDDDNDNESTEDKEENIDNDEGLDDSD